MNHVTVAIATYENRIVNAIEVANGFIKLGVKVLIVHQSDVPYSNKIDSEIVYIHTNTRGVTISRNIAIKNIDSGYIWFMDDDIKIINDQSLAFLRYIEKNDYDVYLCRIINENGELRKRYPKPRNKIKKIDILNVGTIELVVKKETLAKSLIQFPEDMGAGSDLPVGDESVFLSRLISSGYSVTSTNFETLIHPEESSGTIFTKSFLNAKKLSLIRIFGKKGLLLYILFCIKNRIEIKKQNISLIKAVLLKCY